MSFTVKVFGKELLSVGKAFNPQAFLTGSDGEANGGARLSSAYQQSSWVYSCVSAIAEQVAQIPFRFSRAERVPAKERHGRWRRKATGEHIVETGEIVALFNQPHPFLNRFQFWELLVSWLQLRGEFFTVPTDRNLSPGIKRARQMCVLSPDDFREVVRSNALFGWQYTGSGQQSPLPTLALIPEDVITDRLANPYDFWRGMSPLTVARLAAQTDYASAQFMKGLMLNNADTGVIVTTDQQVDEPQREAILSALRDRKRKAGTADRPLFLWGGAKVEKPTLSSADMQFLEQRKFNRQEICAIFKVPQEIIGFTEDANRSVSESARLNFIENRIMPLLERIEAAFDPFIKAHDSGLWGWFDIESLPIMQKARQSRYAGASAAFAMGVPIDECSEIFDLGLPDNLPHAGRSYLPFSLQEVGSADNKTDATQTTDEPPTQNIFERATAWLHNAQRSTLNSQLPTHTCAANPEYEASIQGSVKVKKGALQKFFFEQRSRVLAALQALNGKATKSGEHFALTTVRALDDLFDMNQENQTLLGRMRSRLIADLEFGGAQLFKEIGAGNFNLPPAEALAFLEKRANPIKKINETTWDALKTSLQQGIEAGESYEQLQNRVKAEYNQASEQRADTIAFTETNIAVNSGRNTAMVQAKVERKGWQTSNLENTRQSHFKNQQLTKESGGIPLNDAWPNGLMFPGDPSGAPEETINCRCFGYALVGKGREARGDRKLLTFTEWAQARFHETEASK
jgi:HK97 family phage portal protein